MRNWKGSENNFLLLKLLFWPDFPFDCVRNEGLVGGGCVGMILLSIHWQYGWWIRWHAVGSWHNLSAFIGANQSVSCGYKQEMINSIHLLTRGKYFVLSGCCKKEELHNSNWLLHQVPLIQKLVLNFKLYLWMLLRVFFFLQKYSNLDLIFTKQNE